MIARPLSRRLTLPLVAGVSVALTLLTQAALGQNSAQNGVAGGFRQTAAPGPAQRLNAAIQQLGIRACAPVFNQAGSFLFENGRAEFVVQPLGPDTNRWPTVVTAESAHPAATPAKAEQTRLTTLVIAPAGTCSGVYQQVIYWPQTCAALKAGVFKAFAGDRPLLERVRQSEANPGLQLYLMPAGSGCISVKKELIG